MYNLKARDIGEYMLEIDINSIYLIFYAGAAGIGQSRLPTPVLLCDSLDSITIIIDRVYFIMGCNSQLQIFLMASKNFANHFAVVNGPGNKFSGMAS